MHISKTFYLYWVNVGECGKPIRSTEAAVVGEGFVTTRCCQQRGLVPSPWGEGDRGGWPPNTRLDAPQPLISRHTIIHCCTINASSIL